MKTALGIWSVALLFGLSACSGSSKGPGWVCPEQTPTREVDIQPDDTFPAGPYLMHTTETQASILWVTDEECNGQVAYGIDAARLDQVMDAAAEVVMGGKMVHRARLEGLEPDTRVAYQVSACGLTSGVHHFYTAPEVGTPVRFTVWGDSRTDIAQCKKTVQAMALTQPHFNLHTGDVVTDGDIDQQWIDEFLEPLGPLGHEVPTYVAVGNHERNADLYYKLIDYPIPPALSDHVKFGANYSFTYGNVFFLILDINSPMLLFADQLESELTEWIRAQLESPAAMQATWRIAATHEPAFSEGWSPGGCERFEGNYAVRDWLFPLLTANDFQVYFAGHTHDYERGQVDGMVQIISGGGGASLDQWCRDYTEVDVVELSYHYLEVEAGCDTLTIKAFHIPAEAEPFDTVVIRKDEGL